MIYRRRSAPVSALRARLQQHLAGRDDGLGDEDPGLGEGLTSERSSLPLSALRNMRRYFLLKLTIAVALVLAAALLTRGGYTWGAPLLQGLRFAVEWDLDASAWRERTGPAFGLLADRLELPAMKLPGRISGAEVLPLAGNLQSGFGLRSAAEGGREEMHYGVDLVAPEGTAVKALRGGRVERIAPAGDSSAAVLIASEPGWTVLYRGLAAVEVAEGETVSEGMRLGKLGPPRRYQWPHLHLELRFEGRPVAPPAGWLARFTAPAKHT